MVKKIKDLTIKELLDIQKKICTLDLSCTNCIFFDCCVSLNIDLEKEVEVFEDGMIRNEK